MQGKEYIYNMYKAYSTKIRKKINAKFSGGIKLAFIIVIKIEK